jgi:glycosyltransferase involved in cell wall biosynthesis
MIFMNVFRVLFLLERCRGDLPGFYPGRRCLSTAPRAVREPVAHLPIPPERHILPGVGEKNHPPRPPEKKAGMNRETITAIVMTFNEEHNIGQCLERLTWVDELIVADTGSTDGTVEIAKDYTDEILSLPWHGYGPTRNLALRETTCDWFLFVDADERVTDELREEILAVLSERGDRFTAYRIPRRSNFAGRWIRGCGWYPGYITRMARNSTARYTDATVHEKLVTEGTVGTLNGDLLHYTDPDLERYLKKDNLYTTLAADDMVRAGKKPRMVNLLFNPLMMFLKMFFVRRGFRDGFEGFALCVLSSFSVFTKYAKARLTWRRRTPSPPEGPH